MRTPVRRAPIDLARRINICIYGINLVLRELATTKYNQRGHCGSSCIVSVNYKPARSAKQNRCWLDRSGLPVICRSRSTPIRPIGRPSGQAATWGLKDAQPLEQQQALQQALLERRGNTHASLPDKKRYISKYNTLYIYIS